MNKSDEEIIAKRKKPRLKFIRDKIKNNTKRTLEQKTSLSSLLSERSSLFRNVLEKQNSNNDPNNSEYQLIIRHYKHFINELQKCCDKPWNPDELEKKFTMYSKYNDHYYPFDISDPISFSANKPVVYGLAVGLVLLAGGIGICFLGPIGIACGAAAIAFGLIAASISISILLYPPAQSAEKIETLEKSLFTETCLFFSDIDDYEPPSSLLTQYAQ